MRHTFCVSMCENQSNVKVVQEIMEHISIAPTMYMYNKVTRENKLEVSKRLNGRIAIRGEDTR